MEKVYHGLSDAIEAACLDESVALPVSPYFDERLGSVPGSDRTATTAAMEAMRAEAWTPEVLEKCAPPPPPAGDVSTQEQRSAYGKLLAWEIAVGATGCCSCLGGAIEDTAWRECGIVVQPPPENADKVVASRTELAVLLLPLAVRCARHVGAGFAVLPLALVLPLEIDDRTDFWSRFFREETVLELPSPPAEVEFGERSLKRSKASFRMPLVKTTREKPPPLPKVIDDDVASLLKAASTSRALEWLVRLREKIQEVATPRYADTRLREWGEPRAAVVAWALGAAACRVDYRRDEDSVAHGVPVALSLVEAYEASTRATLGLSTLLRILQVAAPTQLAAYEPIVYEALENVARTLATDDAESAALMGRCVLRLVSVVDDPVRRQKRASQCVETAIEDATRLRVEDCRIEALRWRLSPTMLLHLNDDPNAPFEICAHLRRLVPVLAAVATARGPGVPALCALRSLHATAALAWPRVRGNLLEELLTAAVVAANKALIAIKAENRDAPFARYAPLVLLHLERFLALLILLNTDTLTLLSGALKKYAVLGPLAKRAVQRAKQQKNNKKTRREEE